MSCPRVLEQFCYFFTAKWHLSLPLAVQVQHPKTFLEMCPKDQPSMQEPPTEAPDLDRASTGYLTRPRTPRHSTLASGHPISSQRFRQNFRKGISRFFSRPKQTSLSLLSDE